MAKGKVEAGGGERRTHVRDRLALQRLAPVLCEEREADELGRGGVEVLSSVEKLPGKLTLSPRIFSRGGMVARSSVQRQNNVGPVQSPQSQPDASETHLTLPCREPIRNLIRTECNATGNSPLGRLYSRRRVPTVSRPKVAF